MPELKKLEIGDKAPDFTLSNHDGTKLKLSSLKGEKVIVYFFPAALTPGCTKEATDFNDNLKTLEKAGYTVLGISPDKVEKMAKFQKAHKLKFALLADEDLAVHKKYGAFGTKSMYGRTYEGVLRSTFVVDEKGKISLALYNVKATGHVESLKKHLEI
ncbi:MAG: thioredoxin-dependent thiol peroxidase [Actinomycetota bacterium]